MKESTIVIVFCIFMIWLISDHETKFMVGDIVECKRGYLYTLYEYQLCKRNVDKRVYGIILFNWHYVSVHVPNESGEGRGTNLSLHEDALNLVHRPITYPEVYMVLDK